MSVLSLHREEKAASKNALYLARKTYKLSLSQAAKALRLSPTQVERDELRETPQLDVRRAEQAFEVFIATNNLMKDGKNLLFGYMPLRVARDVLDMPVDEIAKKYRMSPSQWRKMECHARTLETSLLDEIEKDIVSHFDGLCR